MGREFTATSFPPFKNFSIAFQFATGATRHGDRGKQCPFHSLGAFNLAAGIEIQGCECTTAFCLLLMAIPAASRPAVGPTGRGDLGLMHGGVLFAARELTIVFRLAGHED